MNKLITMDWKLLVNKLFIVLGISPEEKNDSTSLYQQHTLTFNINNIKIFDQVIDKKLKVFGFVLLHS